MSETPWERWRRYWDERARAHPGEYVGLCNQDAAGQAERIWPLVATELEGRRHVAALDFGCGPGRFTCHLAAHADTVFCLDILEDQAALAAGRHPGARVARFTGPAVIELPSQSVDLLWSCLTLQHIVDADVYAATVAELRRILRPGARVILIEFGSDMAGASHCKGRSAQDYAEALGLCSYEARQAVLDPGGLPHNILIGTVREPPGTLFVGPLLQEFGHKVMGAGCIRRKARDFARTVVCDLPEYFALYADFAHEFRPHDICVTCDMAGPVDPAVLAGPVAAIQKDAAARGWTVWSPGASLYWGGCAPDVAEFRLLGVPLPGIDRAIVFHARARMELGEDHNWPQDRWDVLGCELAKQLPGVAFYSIGHPAQSFRVAGSVDLRGAALGHVMDLLATAEAAIGPSSGPLHLACQCGCPVVTWNGDGGQDSERWLNLVERWQRLWNPLAAPVSILPRCTWQPEASEVLSAFETLAHTCALRGGKRRSK